MSAATDPALSVQLYSLRRETAGDPAATLRDVPGLGFDGVEMAGDYGWGADRWRDLLAETGLRVVGAHVGLEALERDLAALTVFHRAVGNRRLVVPSVPEHLQSADGYREAARRLNRLGLRAADEGFLLAYHNHAFEFTPLIGVADVGMDLLLRETDPGAVRFEVDTYWVERGGRDAVAFLQQHAARVGLVHAKDLRRDDGADVPLGEGVVDFAAVVPLARAGGWPVVVECEGEDAPAVLRQGAAHLRSLLGGELRTGLAPARPVGLTSPRWTPPRK